MLHVTFYVLPGTERLFCSFDIREETLLADVAAGACLSCLDIPHRQAHSYALCHVRERCDVWVYGGCTWGCVHGWVCTRGILPFTAVHCRTQPYTARTQPYTASTQPYIPACNRHFPHVTVSSRMFPSFPARSHLSAHSFIIPRTVLLFGALSYLFPVS